MGISYKRRIFRERIATLTDKILGDRGESCEASKGLLTRITKEVYERVGDQITDELTHAQVRYLAGRQVGLIGQLLDAEKLIFLKTVKAVVEEIMTDLKVQKDIFDDLLDLVCQEMWAMSGYRVKRGQKPSKVQRTAKKVCEKFLASDLILELRDRLREELREEHMRKGDDEPTDDVIIISWDDENLLSWEEDQPTIVVLTAERCHCGADVLAHFEDREGGQEVALAREGIPAALSKVRPNPHDYMGINPEILA